MYACMYVRTYVCMYVRTYVCMHLCIYLVMMMMIVLGYHGRHSEDIMVGILINGIS